MRYIMRASFRFGAMGICIVGLAACSGNFAHAQGNVVMALDGMIVNNQGGGQAGWGGFGSFNYAGEGGDFAVSLPTTPGLGRYDAFRITESGLAGGGVGVNFTIGDVDSPIDSAITGGITPVTANMFPLLDLAMFGANFDPTQYVAELVYKPNLPTNTATQLNVTFDTFDGFQPDGSRAGEQHQWGFFDLINTYLNTQANGDLDADGFAVAQSNMGVLSLAARNFTGQSFMYDVGNPTGDGDPDFDDFETMPNGPLPVPNGARQLHLQAVFGGAEQDLVDDWEIKALRIRKITPDPTEIARLDGKSGFSLRFGSPFTRDFTGFINVDGTDYDPPITDQLIRFDENGFLPNNAFIINTDDDGAIGGAQLWQSAASTVFDATDATIEIRARLTAPLAGQAENIQILAKDKDGNGTAEMGDFGGEEYLFTVPLSSFNETTMTTLSLPFTEATAQQAQEFATAGDGLLTDFNLYSLGVQTIQDAGLVDLEVEFIRIVVPPPPGLPGDYNGDGWVDAADYTTWRDHLGDSDETALNGNGDGMDGVDAGDYTLWVDNFGTHSENGGAALSGNPAVPEPGTWVLGLIALGLVPRTRRS